MIIVPSTAVETMGLGALGGLTAFGKEIPRGRARNEKTAQGAGEAPPKPES